MLERVRFITRAVGSWLGLRTVPLGILYLYLSIQSLDLPGFPKQGDCTLSCPLFLFMFLALMGIELYYRRTVGWVKLFPKPRPLILAGALVIILGITGWVIDTTSLFPVSLFALFMALCYLVYGRTEKRPFQFTLAILLAVAGVLPLLLSRSPRDPVFGTSGFVIMFLIFLMFTVGGILDHLTIVRLLRSLPGNTGYSGR